MTIYKSNISQGIGSALIEDIFLQKSNYYYGIGRTYPWAAEPQPDEPLLTDNYDKLSRNDIVITKRIDGTSLSFVAKRKDYKSGIVYDIYDDSVEIFDKNFYVMNSDFNVYKCLYNGGGKSSTIEPFGTSDKGVTYSDGYVWKFIYNIPPALRNKFLTPDQIPVYNAITSRYYSRGSISSVLINSTGEGYTQAGTQILVSGDGFLEYNPRKIAVTSIAVQGSGYIIHPDSFVEDPFANSTEFFENMQVLDGQYISVEDSLGKRFYLAESSGELGSIAPSHFYSSFSSGTVPLRHVGTTPLSDITIDDSTVGSVYITEPGFGYINTPNVFKFSPGTGVSLQPIIVNGSLAEIKVISRGTGYTNENIDVDSPYPGAEFFVPEIPFALGTILGFTNVSGTFFYQVTVAGTTGLDGPNHITGSEVNGDCVLTVIGKQATAVAVLGSVTGVELYGDIEVVNLQSGGSGYFTGTELGNPLITTPAAEVTFVGGDPITPAQAIPVIVDGVITKIVVTSAGYGYRSAPDVIISGNGTGSSAIAVLQFGYGYKRSPEIIISEPINPLGIQSRGATITNKTEAKVEPIIIDGRVSGIKVIDGGIGYTTATITVSGDGSGSMLTPIFASGDLTTIQAQSELFTIPGTISSIKIIDGGSNISSIITNLVGDGTGAEITPVVENGILREIRVTNEGSGYTFAEVEVLTNASALTPSTRVILSPVLGHGYNPVKELYSKSVALYGTFSDETNNGFPIANEFRQISIIKNPLKYGKNLLATDKNGTTCFVISTTLGSIPLSKNDILTNNFGRYRVIDFNESEILVQALSNTVIIPGDTLTISINNNNYSIIVKGTTAPSIDKNSGELLFVDNIRAFTPTSSQTISINTVINLL